MVITRIIIIIIIIIQVVSRWDERIVACELDKRNEINNKNTKMARWQVYVGMQVTCRLLLDHTTSQQVSTELHKPAGLFSEEKSGKYIHSVSSYSTCRYFCTGYCQTCDTALFCERLQGVDRSDSKINQNYI